MFVSRRAFLFFFCGWISFLLPAEEARLLRFPAIQGNRIVFTHAGDLYTVASSGGVARRLTSDPKGFEMFARFSPDGKTLAFTGQYDGNTEVYIMPAEGGTPRRLTYTATLERDDVSDRMGPNNLVMGWRDDDSIIYRSRRTQWNPFKGELTIARIGGGVPETLPVPRGGWCSFSPEGKRMVYNRVFREFRTWKRYRGGQADELWLHDFATGKTEPLTTNAAQDIYPMWRGELIYFVSERDTNHQANLYVLELKTKAVRQLTHFTEFAVKFPSIGDSGIVFENGGYIHRFDFDSEESIRVPIEILEDFAIARGGSRDVSKETSSYAIAPDGSRAIIGARGDVFSVPAKNGPTRNLTRSPGTHERDAGWSPDGRWIAYISDRSGEDELWLRAQDGSGSERPLTSNGDTYKYQPQWSPDSKQLAWTDKMNRLQIVAIDTRQVRLAARSAAFEIRDFAWSPDSQWLAFTQPEPRQFANIYLYGLAASNTVQVTDGWFSSRSPTFSSDGKFLFFTSERTFNPTYSQTEWNHVYNDMERIYLLTLASETKSPFAPKSDEVKIPEALPGKGPSTNPLATGNNPSANPDSTTNTPPKVVVKVDAEGLQQRITVLPPLASDYGGLTSVGDKLFYLKKGKLHFFELEKAKETEVGDVSGYRISGDLKKMLVKVGSDFAILDLPSTKLDIGDRKLNLSDLRVIVDPAAEWRQIYAECWRQMRDFLFDPNMHGVDWKAMQTRYEPLLKHVHHRADLTFVIGELIGELNIGHAYVGGGDRPLPERIPTGLLGARLRRDPSGFYQIDRILPGQNWDPQYRSPLTEIGVTIKSGDYILAVNGVSTREMSDVYSALVGTAGKQVRLRINSIPKEEGAHDETVIPTANEQPLYYLAWVLGNIETVTKATQGRIGYVHVPDMGVPGLNEFIKFYYPQLGREALIVDCRGNGGGNVSPMIIERLRREPAMWTVARNGSVSIDPSGQVLGPKALLIDQHSASDGDIVAYRFRKHHLGPIIGQRSWGGVVGIRGSLPLIDGGSLNRPEFSRFDLEGKEWIMEGTGVSPDIDVDNDPTREFQGQDDQLTRAIDELKKVIDQSPLKIPNPPPYPNKSK